MPLMGRGLLRDAMPERVVHIDRTATEPCHSAGGSWQALLVACPQGSPGIPLRVTWGVREEVTKVEALL